MKWRYETYEERRKRIENWHTWFAWYPVSYNGTTYWLQTIERRGQVFSFMSMQGNLTLWEYREKNV